MDCCNNVAVVVVVVDDEIGDLPQVVAYKPAFYLNVNVNLRSSRVVCAVLVVGHHSLY